MQAAYFDYAPTARWYRNYSHNIHLQKLKDIEKASMKRIDQTEPKSRKLLPYLKRDVKDIQKEKQGFIQRENLIILKRLNYLASATSSFKSNTSPSLKNPLSLNYASRKTEAQRIVEENEHLVKRLNRVPSTFNKRLFEREFKKYNRYRKNISKKKWLGIKSNYQKSQKLSPIKETKPSVEQGNMCYEDNNN